MELLIERNFGIMTGKLIKDIESLCAPEIVKSDSIVYFLSPQGAESFPQLMDRAKDLLAWIEKEKFKENILLVSHGDIGKMIYAAYYNLTWLSVLRDFHFGNTDLLVLAERSKKEDRQIVRARQFNI